MNSLNRTSRLVNNTPTPINCHTPLSSHAVADTGCTGHVHSPCLLPQLTAKGVNLMLPNKQRITATHTCLLDLPNVPIGARQGHLFNELAHPLLLIGLLCNHGCEATFTAQQVTISLPAMGKIVLEGSRDPITQLWTIDLTQRSISKQPRFLTYSNITASSAQRLPYQHQERTCPVFHAPCGSPVLSMWINAITNGHYLTWPGLTANLVKAHLPKLVATVKGQLHQQRQNIRSTKPKDTTTTIEDCNPPSEVPNDRTHLVFSSVVEIRNLIATDLTG
jgi:hypothetical protein